MLVICQKECKHKDTNSCCCRKESAGGSRRDFHMHLSPRLLPITAFSSRVNDIANCLLHLYQTPSNTLQSIHHILIMSAPRAKPLEKFITATSKCTLEVCRSLSPHDLPILISTGRLVWQMHCCRIPECSQGHVCKGVYATKELLFGESTSHIEGSGDANYLVTGSSRQETMIA